MTNSEKLLQTWKDLKEKFLKIKQELVQERDWWDKWIEEGYIPVTLYSCEKDDNKPGFYQMSLYSSLKISTETQIFKVSLPSIEGVNELQRQLTDFHHNSSKITAMKLAMKRVKEIYQKKM